MPSRRLDASFHSVSKFDCVGEDSADENARGFVRHVGLFADDRENVSSGDVVNVAHMGPPLENPGRMPVHVAGSAALTSDEMGRVERFLAELELERDAQKIRSTWAVAEYVVRPHVRDAVSKRGRKRFRRFSCAGLVIEAYKDAGLNFIETDEAKLPNVDLDRILETYPELEGRSRPLLSRLGLEGEGPWPVVLPGYVFHALDRSPEAIRDQPPYVPSRGDEFFPRRT